MCFSFVLVVGPEVSDTITLTYEGTLEDLVRYVEGFAPGQRVWRMTGRSQG